MTIDIGVVLVLLPVVGLPGIDSRRRTETTAGWTMIAPVPVAA